MASRDGEDNALWGMKEANIIVLQEDDSSQYYVFMEDLENEGGITQ